MEFAAARFAARLVVVLGHSSCGAVLATIEQLQRPSDEQSPGLRSIVDRIRPAVDGLLTTQDGSRDTLLREAVRANIRLAANQLRHGSSILERLIDHEGLLVIGAEYSLDTGVVAFFDGVPEPGKR